MTKKVSLKLKVDQNYRANTHKYPCGDGEAPCVICGRACKNPKNYLWIHLGGEYAVTSEEGERLNRSGDSGLDLGMQPIGSDCLKKNPELKDFLQK